MRILDRKLEHVERAGADVLLTANPGCLLQLACGVKRRGLNTKVMHVTEMLSKSLRDRETALPEPEAAESTGE